MKTSSTDWLADGKAENSDFLTERGMGDSNRSMMGRRDFKNGYAADKKG